MISFSVSVYLSPIASSEVSSVQVEEVPGGLQGKAETLQVLCVRHCPRFQNKPFVVAIFIYVTAVRFEGGDPHQLFFQKLSF